jgi:two-component sensor histidine kinase
MASQLADVASGTKPFIEPGDAAAEANHRIANNLAIISEYVRSELHSLDREGTPDFLSIRRSLQHLLLRIDAIGRLHRLLTSTSSRESVEIGAYLREIAGAYCSLAPDERIKILFLFDAEALVTAKQAVAIGAIASEALVNSIKHSHPADEPGVISIGCKRIQRDGLVIEIKDDGVGRPHEQCGGAGSDLMRAFAQSLNATLEFIDGHPGQIVRFELPLSDQRSQ